MSFLFLKSQATTVTEVEMPFQTNSDFSPIKITRTRQIVMLCNLSFFKPQTACRCFHEILLYLTFPALDKFFRGQVSGKLKENLCSL